MIRLPLLAVCLSDLALTGTLFMLIPIFPLHATETLGLSAAAAGLVLAVRQFSQNAPMVLSGALADRFSHRTTMLGGMAARALGLASLGFATELPALMLAAVVMAIGGSCFDAASRAAVARLVPPDERLKAFGLLSIVFVLGSSIGPIVGVAALRQGFTFVCLIGAGLLLAAGVLISLALPETRAPADRPPAVSESLATVFADRAFLRFALLSSGLWLLGNALYVALPLHVAQLTGTLDTIGILFSSYALLVLAFQHPIASLTGRRFSPRARISTGLLLSGCGFLLVGMMADVPGLIFCLAIIAFGRMLTEPTYSEVVTKLAPPQSIATYVGLGYVGLGLGGALGNLSAGLLFDLARRLGVLWIPWLVYGLAGLALAALFSRVNYLAREAERQAR